jgi:long chain fatty acid CoA FadD26
MLVIESSIPAVLEDRARQRPDDIAFTFIDYEVDPGGFAESLTWSQVYQRARVVAEELSRCGSVGDRAAILAPQGLDYIVAFLGAMQAGFIAVPLPVPQFGGLDERVSAAVRDSSPAAILTTSAVVGDVMSYAGAQPGRSAPSVIEIDALDFDSPVLDAKVGPLPKTAYLQYTSGSTRQPAGVVVSHKNVITNVGQVFSDYMEHRGKVPPQDTTMVSWLPFYHDLGLIQGVFAPLLAPPEVAGGPAGRPAVVMSPVSFLQKPARWMQLLASNSHSWSAAPNFAFELAVRRTSDEDMAGLDLGGVLGIISGSERIHAATIGRFTERFARFNLPDTTVRPSYGLAEATLYVVSAPTGHSPATGVRLKLSSACEAVWNRTRNGTGQPRAPGRRRCGSSTRRGLRIRHGGGDLGAATTSPGLWRIRKPSAPSGQAGRSVAGHANGPWLRTGDLGVMSEGELFIIGRMGSADRGRRNHYPMTSKQRSGDTGGRVAAISIPNDRSSWSRSWSSETGWLGRRRWTGFAP